MIYGGLGLGQLLETTYTNTSPACQPQKKGVHFLSCKKHTNQFKTHKHKVKSLLEKDRVQGTSVN